MNEKDIENNFLNAFDSIEDDVKKARMELVGKIEEFISRIKQKNEDAGKELLIVNTPESRIKHRNHFWSKFIRNNYIEKWDVDEGWTASDYEVHLRENLSDLIGLRIVCYFNADERCVFDELFCSIRNDQVSYCNLKNDTVKKEIFGKNAHDVTIYKLQAHYIYNQKKYCFEIQLKSMANDLWGEIDHEVVYKARQYQYDDTFVKEISNNLHNTLLASDEQLYQLFYKKYDQKNLINSLFYLQTEKMVFDGIRNDKANKLYHEFFSLFEDDHELVKKYVAHTLLNNTLDSKKDYSSVSDEDVVFFCQEVICRNFTSELLKIKKIADVIFTYLDDSSFFNHISNKIISKFACENDDDCDSSDEEKFDIKEVERILNDHVMASEEKINDYVRMFQGTSVTEFFKNLSNKRKFIHQNAFVELVSVINQEN